MQNFLILSIFVLTATLNLQAADPVICDRSAISGIYEGKVRSMNPYSGKTFLVSTKVEIAQAYRKIANMLDLIEARVDIRCGTKAVPAVYTVRCYEDGTAKLILIYEGSSQCSLGNDPTLYFGSDTLEIHTGLQTPGFEGRYDFQRTGDLTWLF